MKQRREMTDKTAAQYRNINKNKEDDKKMRKHEREKNRSLKVLRKKNVMWKKDIHKIENKNGDIMTNTKQ